MTLEEILLKFNDDIKNIIKTDSGAIILAAVTEIRDILTKYQADQALVEKTMEDEAFAALKLANPDSPVLVDVEAMLNNADKAHTDLINLRNEAIQGILIKYVGG